MISRTFKLCLNAGSGSAPYINVNQYDEGETWLFELYSENGERYIPSSGAIVGVKSDGHGIVNTGTVDSEGRVVITETQQMTASAGRAIYELSIDDLTHGTANFIVAVERKPTDDAVMSDSDLSLIQEAIDSAEVIVEVIGDGDPSEVIGEHVDAWLDNHPEATTTVEDGAITAPKINQSLWDKLLVSEEASGNPASFDDGADDVPVSSLKVALEPIQTGTGDPSPSNIRPIYPANGKNLIPITLANLQAINTAGTWNGNEYTYRGVTYTVNTNGGGGVISITANGTAGYESSLVLVANINPLLTVGETYTMTGCPSGGGSGKYWCTVGASPSSSRILVDYGSSATVTYTSEYDQTTRNAYVVVAKDYTATNVTFMPQIERGSSVSSYQPYQGIMVDVKGRNLFDLGGWLTSIGISYTQTADGYYNFIPTEAAYTGRYTMPSGIKTVYLSVGTGNEEPTPRVRCTKADGTFTDIYATSAPLTADIVGLSLNWSGGSNVMSIKVMAEYGTEATTYEAYNSNSTSYPYTLGQSVYGGTVDLTTGVLTVDRAMVDLGTLTWQYQSTWQSWYTDYISDIKGTSTGTEIPKFISEKYLAMATNYGLGPNDRIGITTTVRASNGCRILVKNGSTSTTPSGYLVYELVTPITVQLTPTEVKTLLGYNNISSSGTVDVIYHADTKLYVDKMTTVDNNIIAPTEADFVATRNYTVNDLVIVADTLYKVTANIASGSAITPNSNVTQTTLGALIKALS